MVSCVIQYGTSSASVKVATDIVNGGLLGVGMWALDRFYTWLIEPEDPRYVTPSTFLDWIFFGVGFQCWGCAWQFWRAGIECEFCW
jgi:hypothetical protein